MNATEKALRDLADRWFQTGRNDFVLCATELRALLAAAPARDEGRHDTCLIHEGEPMRPRLWRCDKCQERRDSRSNTNCAECGHDDDAHGDLGCAGEEGMGCDCPGWLAPESPDEERRNNARCEHRRANRCIREVGHQGGHWFHANEWEEPAPASPEPRPARYFCNAPKCVPCCRLEATHDAPQPAWDFAKGAPAWGVDTCGACGEPLDARLAYCTACGTTRAPSPAPARASNACPKHGGYLHKPLACPDCWPDAQMGSAPAPSPAPELDEGEDPPTDTRYPCQGCDGTGRAPSPAAPLELQSDPD